MWSYSVNLSEILQSPSTQQHLFILTDFIHAALKYWKDLPLCYPHFGFDNRGMNECCDDTLSKDHRWKVQDHLTLNSAVCLYFSRTTETVELRPGSWLSHTWMLKVDVVKVKVDVVWSQFPLLQEFASEVALRLPGIPLLQSAGDSGLGEKDWLWLLTDSSAGALPLHAPAACAPVTESPVSCETDGLLLRLRCSSRGVHPQ